MKQPIKFKEISNCSWCKRRATHKGADGTFSCGSGQGDGKAHHCTTRVLYRPMSGNGFGYERLR